MRERQYILNDAKLLYDFLSDTPAANETADIILAAGSHDIRVAEHAAAIFHQGAAPIIICSGGLGKITEGLWKEPEAVLFSRRCEERGVPSANLIIEKKASNTGENFSFSRKLAYSLGLHPRTGIIVCKPYMGKRAWAAACRQWPELSWHTALPPISFSDYENNDCPMEQEIDLMVGDLQRLRVYAELGYQIPVEVPVDIWSAYERLTNDGYNRYVIPSA
ncbi:MAG: YdcF family protein [Oscillospiraceae bacterium]|nr:YdcF family protein [Oscillospiraceae bacterium]